jgi:hypothetical protein
MAASEDGVRTRSRGGGNVNSAEHALADNFQQKVDISTASGNSNGRQSSAAPRQQIDNNMACKQPGNGNSNSTRQSERGSHPEDKSRKQYKINDDLVVSRPENIKDKRGKCCFLGLLGQH